MQKTTKPKHEKTNKQTKTKTNMKTKEISIREYGDLNP